MGEEAAGASGEPSFSLDQLVAIERAGEELLRLKQDVQTEYENFLRKAVDSWAKKKKKGRAHYLGRRFFMPVFWLPFLRISLPGQRAGHTRLEEMVLRKFYSELREEPKNEHGLIGRAVAYVVSGIQKVYDSLFRDNFGEPDPKYGVWVDYMHAFSDGIFETSSKASRLMDTVDTIINGLREEGKEPSGEQIREYAELLGSSVDEFNSQVRSTVNEVAGFKECDLSVKNRLADNDPISLPQDYASNREQLYSTALKIKNAFFGEIDKLQGLNQAFFGKLYYINRFNFSNEFFTFLEGMGYRILFKYEIPKVKGEKLSAAHGRILYARSAKRYVNQEVGK